MSNNLENQENIQDLQNQEIQQEENAREPNQEQQESEGSQENENDLMYIYEWVDSIPLSRQKKNIARDFSDGLLLAEIIKSYIPNLVELHNYPSCSNLKNKKSNWTVLNNKVLKKIGIRLTEQEVQDIITAQPLAIEHLLQRVYMALESKLNINLQNIDTRKNDSLKAEDNEKLLEQKLEEKENIIRQLNDIIEVLELKKKNSDEMVAILENKVNQLTENLRNK